VFLLPLPHSLWPHQVEAFDTSLDVYGSLAFLLWRSVYITKQVSFRNRVLILFDWMKARVFGRDLSQF
jgi:NADH:ubiquinone reductase (non-electrogenic)